MYRLRRQLCIWTQGCRFVIYYLEFYAGEQAPLCCKSVIWKGEGKTMKMIKGMDISTLLEEEACGRLRIYRENGEYAISADRNRS